MVAIDPVSLPPSLVRRAAPAVVPLCLSVLDVVLSLTDEASLTSALQAVGWAAVAATILVPAWRDRRLSALTVDEEGLRGPRGESILRWDEVAGIWVGYQRYRWLPSPLRPLTLLAWDAASIDFARRADSRALPRAYKLIATTAPDQEVVKLLQRFTSLPVEAGEHLSRRRFLRTLMYQRR